MNNSILPQNKFQSNDVTQPERSNADRMVLALRYPVADDDAEPLCAVSKRIGERVYLLAVYDADTLAALVRMGWGVA